MQDDRIIIHHTDEPREEIREKIAEVKVSKPTILIILTVIAYVIMSLNFLVGIFMNISYFEPDVFRPYLIIHGLAITIKFMTYAVNPIFIVLLLLLPLLGILGVILIRKYEKFGFWMFSLSQLFFLAIPLIIFSKSSHLSMIIISLLHSIIILPSVIAYYTYFYYFRKL